MAPGSPTTETSAPLLDVVVIGAGPAGLATSRELTRRGIGHVVLERGPEIACTWANLYDGLVLHTGKHLSALPGMAFPASTPLFPPRQAFLDYLHRYADAFRVPVETSAEVTEVIRSNAAWVVRTATGTERRSRALVVATGIVSNPQVPDIPGRASYRGRVSHSIEYRRPEPFRGQRVLVIGAGNSGGEISAELAGAGARVTVAIRSGVRVVPRQMLGIPTQYFGFAIGPLPRPAQRRLMAITSKLGEMMRGRSPLPPQTDGPKCAPIPLIGFHLSDAVRAGTIRLQRGVESFTADGMRFSDGSSDPFDHVMLAPIQGVAGLPARSHPAGFVRLRLAHPPRGQCPISPICISWARTTTCRAGCATSRATHASSRGSFACRSS